MAGDPLPTDGQRGAARFAHAPELADVDQTCMDALVSGARTVRNRHPLISSNCLA